MFDMHSFPKNLIFYWKKNLDFTVRFWKVIWVLFLKLVSALRESNIIIWKILYSSKSWWILLLGHRFLAKPIMFPRRIHIIQRQIRLADLDGWTERSYFSVAIYMAIVIQILRRSFDIWALYLACLDRVYEERRGRSTQTIAPSARNILLKAMHWFPHEKREWNQPDSSQTSPLCPDWCGIPSILDMHE